MKCMMLNCKNCSTNLNCMCSDITLETKDGQLVCNYSISKKLNDTNCI